MRKSLICLAALCAVGNAAAQWTTDLNKNTQITPTSVDYFEHAQMTTDQGNTYIYFICPVGTTSMKMRLQIVDREGNRVLGRGGSVFAQNANRTWTTFNQLMALDKEQNAIVPVWDMRDDPSEDASVGGSYYMYKFDQGGKTIWDGKPLKHSLHPIEAGLSMLPTDDGGVLCGYFSTISTDDLKCDSLNMTRLDVKGDIMWSKNVHNYRAWTSPYTYLVDAGDGNALFFWANGQELLGQIVDTATGEFKLDKDVVVYDGGFGSQKIWESLDVQPGPDHSAILRVFDGYQRARVAIVNADATSGLGGLNGVELTTDDGWKSTMPEVLYKPEENCLLCVYKTAYDDNTNLQGVYMQRVGMDGELGDRQTIFDYTDEVMFAYMTLRPLDNGRTAMFYMDKYAGVLDVAGHWTTIDKGADEIGEIQDFTTSAVNKENLWVSTPVDGNTFFTGWDQKPVGENFLFYMQNVEIPEQSGINEMVNDNADSSKTYYDLLGHRVQPTNHGIFIERNADGARKVKL